MKEIWKGEPQFTYDYGGYGHYYTPIVRHHEDTYYGSKQYLGDKLVQDTSVTIWDHIISIFYDKHRKYERYVREEHTWVFDPRAHAIAFMSRNGLNMEEAARLTEKVEAECP